MTTLTLFRGDKKGNDTTPERHYTAGLSTRQINHGDPAYISKAGLVKALRVHIAPESITEEELRSKSHFLSFSANRSRALFFAGDSNPDNLMPGEGDNQRYLFTLDVSSRVPTERNGVFLLSYKCDLIICEYCTSKKQAHNLLLIDVVTFLSTNSSYAKTDEALNNARSDSEWLVLPIDYIPRLNGFQARIVPTPILDVESYFLTE